MSQLYYYIFFKGQTSYYISGHQCTVTRRCVHLQVIKDADVCLFQGQRSNAEFVVHDQLVSTFRRGVHPLHEGQNMQTVFSTSSIHNQFLLWRGVHFTIKGQYTVFVSVCSDQVQFIRDSRPKIHSLILVTGAKLTKSLNCLHTNTDHESLGIKLELYCYTGRENQTETCYIRRQ